MLSVQDIKDFMGRLEAKRAQAGFAYAQAWRGSSKSATKDGTFPSVCHDGVARLWNDCKTANPGFNPRLYASWYVVTGKPANIAEIRELDFPEPNSLEKLLNDITAGTEPGSSPSNRRPAKTSNRPTETREPKKLPEPVL